MLFFGWLSNGVSLCVSAVQIIRKNVYFAKDHRHVTGLFVVSIERKLQVLEAWAAEKQLRVKVHSLGSVVAAAKRTRSQHSHQSSGYFVVKIISPKMLTAIFLFRRVVLSTHCAIQLSGVRKRGSRPHFKFEMSELWEPPSHSLLDANKFKS